MKKSISYDIYTGLTDKNNNKAFSLDEFKIFVNNFLSKYKVNYFLTCAVGGYVKEDNSYLIEDIIDVDDDTFHVKLSIKDMDHKAKIKRKREIKKIKNFLNGF